MQKQVDVVIATPGHSMEAEYVRSLVATISVLQERGVSFHFSNRYSSRVSAAREATAMDSDFLDAFNRYPMRGEIAYKKLFWIDSDMSWEPSDFLALYMSDLDIVSGVYLSSQGVPMFSPLEGGDMRKILSETKPIKVMAVGFGFVCVASGVFESMQRPWFETKFERIVADDGTEMFIPMGEDYSWCASARSAGYDICIDPLTRVTHNKKVPIK